MSHESRVIFRKLDLHLVVIMFNLLYILSYAMNRLLHITDTQTFLESIPIALSMFRIH